MKKTITGIVTLMLLTSAPVMAMDKTATGAVLGATAGAIAGKDVVRRRRRGHWRRHRRDAEKGR